MQPGQQTNRRGPMATPQNRAPQPGRQPMRAPMGDMTALRRYLNLDDAQMHKLMQAREQAGRQAEEKAKSLEPQIAEKRRAPQELMEKGGDATAVGKAMLDLRSFEKQRQQAHDAARTSYLSVLTAEQRTRFKAIEDAALLPAATREAIAMGLVPGVPSGPMRGPGGPQQGRQRMQRMQGEQRMRGMQAMPGRGMGQPGPNPPGPRQE